MKLIEKTYKQYQIVGVQKELQQEEININKIKQLIKVNEVKIIEAIINMQQFKANEVVELTNKIEVINNEIIEQIKEEKQRRKAEERQKQEEIRRQQHEEKEMEKYYKELQKQAIEQIKQEERRKQENTIKVLCTIANIILILTIIYAIFAK